MKKGIHPENYRPVVFRDMSNGDMFLTKSTAKTNDTVEFEGETYPVVKVEISSSSLTPSILVRASSLTRQVVLISS